MSKQRRRDTTLTIRLTKAEKERIERNAKHAERSITDYLVLLSLETPIHVAEDVKPLLIELKRIGNNLNQITAKINAVRFKARMDTEPGFLSELSGMFSNRTEWHPLPMFEATPENCEAFRRWLDSQWAELPEALPTQTAAELVGHSPQRIHEWIRKKVLVGIKLGTIQYCAKAEFVNFMASPQRLAHPRTEKYKDLIWEFKYIQRRERENEQRNTIPSFLI